MEELANKLRFDTDTEAASTLPPSALKPRHSLNFRTGGIRISRTAAKSSEAVSSSRDESKATILGPRLLRA